MEAWVLIGVLDVVIDGVPITVLLLSMVHVFVACHLFSIVVDFILLFIIYWFLFWVGQWYLLSTCSLYWPLLVFSSLSFCGVQQACHRLWLALSSSKSSAHHSSGWAIIPSSCWILSFMSWCLRISDMGHLFTCFVFLNTLRFGNLRIDVLDVMTFRFWG